MRVDIQLVSGEHHTWYQRTDGNEPNLRTLQERAFDVMNTPTQAKPSLRFDGVENGASFSRTYPLSSILWWTVRQEAK